jgi:hypothetical protein
MENIHNFIEDKIWNRIEAEMRELEKDEISSKVIKKVSQLVSLRIMDQIRFTVWHQVCEEVKKEF